MICPRCGASINDGLKFCEQCGAPLQKPQPEERPEQGADAGAAAGSDAGAAGAAGADAGARADEYQSHRKEKPTARYSSERADQDPTVQPKPDFEPHSEYRRETFEQGPVPTPTPADPLPMGEGASGSVGAAGAAGAGAAGAGGASSSGPKPPRRSCLMTVIALLALLLLISVSCSMMNQCASTLGEQTWTPSSGGTGGTTTSNAGGGTTTNNISSSGSAPVSAKDSWTVLFYLCGSNLETESGLATVNLQELASSKLGDKVTFAIETGGAKRWKNSSVDPRYLTRYSISSDGFYEREKLPSASMAQSSTFADFLSWGISTYPADHYMLVMWDHGGGSVYGVCNDELYPRKTSSFFDTSNDTLTLTEMTDAMKQTGAKFDVIGFDTCLMGTYETAAMLSPFADYLVASEEVEPGSGWDYVSWPQWLGAHTSATGAQLGAQICDSYYTKCRLYNAADMATLSVVDLSKLGNLNDSFLGASREIAMATTDRKLLRTLYAAAKQTMSFGGGSSYNMVDLADLMKKSSSVAAEYYDDVIKGVSEAVVYCVNGRSRSKASGLSVFYPLDTSYKNEFYDFLDVAANVPYAQFAAVMFGQYNSVDWTEYAATTPVKSPVQEEGIDIGFEESIDDQGRLQIQVTRGQDDIADVSVEMAVYLPDQSAMVFLGEDRDLSADEQAGVYADNFYGQWKAIDGNWVSSTLLETGEGYSLYYIPVLLNGESANLIARHDDEAGTYEIICSCAAVEEGSLAPKQMRALEPGDQVEFQFEGYLMDSDQPITFEMGEVTWAEGTTMSDVDLGEGAFLFRFVLTDVLGQQHYSNLYVQEYVGDTVTVKGVGEYLQSLGFGLN